MKCYIIGSAPHSDLGPICAIKKGKDDCVICADGGFEYAKQAGLKPDYVVGDFDSVKQEVETGNYEIVKFNKYKDDTDAKLAVLKGIEKGYTQFEFYACAGGRFDHMYANILLLLWIANQGYQAKIVDIDASYYFMEKETTFHHKKNRTVSLFAIAQPVKGICLEGFRYPLHNHDMPTEESLGISNVIVEDEAKISISGGKLLVVEFNKEL